MLLIGILFGLAMDYEVFLVSRMRENFVRSGKARESVITGYGQSGRVVIGGGADHDRACSGRSSSTTTRSIKSIGLSLAFGVLADAFVVRMTLVPGRDGAARAPRLAAAALARPAASRTLDIEGEQLVKRLKEAPAQA